MSNLLKEVVNESAYLKCAIMGFSGAGKTHTGSKLAIGLTKYCKLDKPVAFLDTEKGSDFMIPMFEKEGIKLLRKKSRSFADLLAVTKEAEQTCGVLLIDSMTHFWTGLVKDFMKKRGISKMYFQHW